MGSEEGPGQKVPIKKLEVLAVLVLFNKEKEQRRVRSLRVVSKPEGGGGMEQAVVSGV